MRVRALTPTDPATGLGGGDMTFGAGSRNYFINDPRGVGQIVSTRLRLWRGDWFLNTQDGTPWATEVLGKYTEDVRDMVIQDRIYGAPGVLDIRDYNSQLVQQTRDWTVHAEIDTVYGKYVLNGPI